MRWLVRPVRGNPRQPERPASAGRSHVETQGAALNARPPAGPHGAGRRSGDRLLRDPLPARARVALDRRVLPLRVGAAAALADRALGGAALGGTAVADAPLGMARRRVLRRRPD